MGKLLTVAPVVGNMPMGGHPMNTKLDFKIQIEFFNEWDIPRDLQTEIRYRIWKALQTPFPISEHIIAKPWNVQVINEGGPYYE